MKAACTRYSRLFALLIAVCTGLAACATRPPSTPRTTVVLLPDDDGKVGAVTVSTATGSQLLQKALSQTMVEKADARPSPASAMAQETLDRRYGALLGVQPPKPKTFILNFLVDKTELTAESKALLPGVFTAARARKPASIMVFGHTDATGSSQRNLKLSEERAEAIAELLRRNDPTLDDIEVQFFGATRPLAPSDASEVRNRRVEILIL